LQEDAAEQDDAEDIGGGGKGGWRERKWVSQPSTCGSRRRS
jgi:hypothetical protein